MGPLALLAAATLSTASSAVPPCRLESRDAKAVSAAIAIGVRARQGAGLSAVGTSNVVVNEDGAEQSLRVDLISDLDSGLSGDDHCPVAGRAIGEADGRTIVEVCRAAGERYLQCSSNAVHALLSADPRHRAPNLALALLLAHELAHLAHHDPGAFVSPVSAIGLGLPRSAKQQALQSACVAALGDDLQKHREQRADDEAIAVIEALVAEEMKSDEVAGPKGAQSLALGSLEASLSGLRQWQAHWFGRRDLPPIETPSTADDPGVFAQWKARRLICDVLAPGKGSALVPLAAADHPLGSVRLAQLSLRVAALPVLKQTKQGSSSTGNGRDLLAAMTGVIVMVDKQEALADAALVDSFCKEVQGPQVDCATIPERFPHAAGESCPELTADLTWGPLAEPAIERPMETNGAITALGPIEPTFARPLRDGRLLIGSVSALGIGSPSGSASWVKLPCTPRDAIERTTDTLVLCDHPLGAIRVTASGPVAFGRAQSTFNGEPDDEQSQIVWAGRVSGRELAVFRSGSGPSRTIDVSADHWITARPWSGKGCETLVYGMAIGAAGKDLFGATVGHPSILRTARFDGSFLQLNSFTARARPEKLGCGLGLVGPVCLTNHGELVDPEPSKPRILATISKTNQLRAQSTKASICSSDNATFVALVGQGPPEPGVALYRLADSQLQRVFEKRGATAGELRCDVGGATFAVADEQGGSVVRAK